MNPFHRLAHRLRALYRKRELEREMAEEMQFHLEERIAENLADGLPPGEARCAAQRRFGNTASLQEQAREQRGWMWLENLIKDFRLGVRSLLKSPGFTFLAVITLGLGIGANTAMFSVLNGVMLRPLPYPDSERLDRIYRATPQNPEGGISPADFFDLQREMRGYGEVAACASWDASLSEPARPPEMAWAMRITANLLSTLGTQPQLGRDFRRGEDIRGNDRIVIISQRFWQNHLGGRADVIGRTLRVDGEPHEIVGVLPASFNDWRHLGWVDVFRPLGFDQEKSADRKGAVLEVIGRRATHLSRAEAARFISDFGTQLATDFPEVNAGSSWRVAPLHESAVGKDAAVTLGMLVGLSGFVLLIACSNLANLLLARTIARAREFAVRSALGASRTQLLRPLIAESLLLAAAGGVCAIIIAMWATDWLAVRSTGDNGEAVVLALDRAVLGWALAASLVTAVAFGLAPALFAMRLNLNGALKSGARGTTGGRNHQRFRHALIIGQFALAMVLLTGAALFIRGLDDLNQRRSGWDSDHLVTGTILLPSASYPTPDRITGFHRLALERLQSLPGVSSASVASFQPFFNWHEVRKYLVKGRATPEPGHEPAATVNSVSPRYFETVGTHLLAGRAFNERDTLASPKVFIINQAMARGLFGDEDPVGRHLAQTGEASSAWGEIVGVVSDVRSVSPEQGAVIYQLYQPMAQEPRARIEIAVRAAVAPATLVDSIRSAMAKLDADLPVRKLLPADARILRANYQLGVLRDMLTSFALLGLALASLGIYGVIARTTAQRTSEFAIRLALGAGVRNITRMVLTTGVKLAVIGSAVGLLGALAVSMLLASEFPNMPFERAPIIVTATAFLITVALIACYVPARRAASVDPMTALRAE